MLLPLAAVAHVVLATRTEKSLLHARLAVVTTLLTLVAMAAIRQLVHSAYVAPSSSAATVERYRVIRSVICRRLGNPIRNAEAGVDEPSGTCPARQGYIRKLIKRPLRKLGLSEALERSDWPGAAELRSGRSIRLPR